VDVNVDRLLRCALSRVVPSHSPFHGEIVESAIANGHRRGGMHRTGEALSAAALGLRLRGQVATRDSASEIVRQGAALAGPVVLAGVAAWTWSERAAQPAVGAAVSVLLLLAALVSPRRVGPAVAIGAAVVWIAAGSTPAFPIAAGALVAATLVAVGATSVRQPSRRCPVAGALSIAALIAMAAVGGPDVVDQPGLVVAAAVLPAVPLALGWLDPRLAVAATTIWLWRFLSVDLADLASGLADLTGELSVQSIVVRWLLMGTGVAAGWLVTHQAIARSREI
jgi:hypothetical protein